MGFFGRVFGRARGAGETPEQLRALIEKAMNGLAAVTAAHDSTWGLGQADWNVDQQAGTIVFQSPSGVRAAARVQIIGTYNTADGTWLWGWDHPSVEAPLAEDAKRVLEYGRQHGFTRLTTRKLECTEEECWELTALAFHLCEANGAYRGPSGDVRVFLTFGEVQLSHAR